MVKCGASTWNTPVDLKLAKGGAYTFQVIHEDPAGIRYLGESLMEAGWTGKRVVQVALEADKQQAEALRRAAELAECRGSAVRCFDRKLWNSAAMMFEKLLTAGEPLTEHGPPLVTCLLKAQETPPQAYVQRMDMILSELERAGRADLVVPLRQQIQAKLDARPKRTSQ